MRFYIARMLILISLLYILGIQLLSASSKKIFQGYSFYWRTSENTRSEYFKLLLLEYWTPAIGGIAEELVFRGPFLFWPDSRINYYLGLFVFVFQHCRCNRGILFNVRNLTHTLILGYLFVEISLDQKHLFGVIGLHLLNNLLSTIISFPHTYILKNYRSLRRDM